MEKLTVNIKNCYGIERLEHEFDFTNGKSTQIIYAPNGVMKTSFANVLDDHSKGNESKDLIFPDKESLREIIWDREEVNPESIFVIRPYERSFKSNKMSTLLVSEDLRKQYDSIHEIINLKKEKLFKLLSPLTGLKKDIEKAFCDSFNNPINNSLQLFSKLEEEVCENTQIGYGHIIFNKIFNEKVITFLQTGDIKNQIKLYIEKYNELISKSPILRKEFNHYHASTVHKNLSDNGFFKAEHSINLNIQGKKQEVTDPKELLKIINVEKDSILKDKSLQSIFNNIDKKITNAQLREFREYLFEHQEILTELANLETFKHKLWISYLKDIKSEYIDLVDEFKKGQHRIKEIFEKAKNEQTDWENVIEIFNRRFFVPYRLSIKNKEDTILKDEAPTINYYFEDRQENVDEELLLRVLSQGELRTLYLLNIIFEIESRKKQGLKTLFIVDDIADSFDYKNKYAIIEYLKDISLHDHFFSIILTHNFDFFRTVQERISGNSKYQGSFMAIKESHYIRLESLRYKYISNPLKNWKKELSDKTKLIASVTFARNIAEYIGDDENFNKLTSILHMKDTTLTLSVKDLQETYKCIFKDMKDLELEGSEKTLYEIINEVADSIVNSETESIANLENKVVLSIAIRLNAEKYMINLIDDPEFISSINKNQTGVLFGRFKKRYPDELKSIEILERVNIMTPENIHLNSFMFEPILDISDLHLKQLYNEVLQLLIAWEEHESSIAQVAATISEE